jgi:hypothetical protein
MLKGVKKQFALLIIILLISSAYAIHATKMIGVWGAVFFVFVWLVVFWWARKC